jgi:hypothetical protein
MDLASNDSGPLDAWLLRVRYRLLRPDVHESTLQDISLCEFYQYWEKYLDKPGLCIFAKETSGEQGATVRQQTYVCKQKAHTDSASRHAFHSRKGCAESFLQDLPLYSLDSSKDHYQPTVRTK